MDLTVRVLDDQGEEIAGATVSWSSSNTKVATVDSGVMTAVGVGSVTLTARATLRASSTHSSVTGRSAAAASRASGQEVAQSEGSISGSIDVEVVSRASRIEITPASVSFEEVGARATLTATIYDQDGNVTAAHLLGLVFSRPRRGDGGRSIPCVGNTGFRTGDRRGNHQGNAERERERDGHGRGDGGRGDGEGAAT